MQNISPSPTQEETSTRRNRIRTRNVVAASVALIGLIAGTGSFVQSAMASTANVAAAKGLSGRAGLGHVQLGPYSKVARAHAENSAEKAIYEANIVIVAVRNKVDVTPLATSVISLASYESLDPDTLVSLIDRTRTAAANATSAAAEVDREKAVAARAAAKANSPSGARATARAMAQRKYGWGASQFSCLVQLWNKESGWSYKAYNPSSGAAGIPQALPGSKMASAGSNWKNSAATQISWGLAYISRGYGTPCSAWSHSESMNWY